MKDTEELRKQSDEELQSLLEEKRNKLYQLKCSLARNDKDAKPHFLREERRDIARILTVLRMRQIEVSK